MALAALHTLGRRPRGLFRRGLLLAACMAAFLSGGFAAFLEGMRPAPAPAGTERADAIVALTGDPERLDAAVRLLERGVANRLLITGVHRETSHAELARVLPSAGARFACCADLGHEAQDTAGNADEAAAWAAQRGYRRIVLVTSSFHMPRSLVEFAHAMPGAQITPHPVAAARAGPETWWRDRDQAGVVVGEYAKLLAAIARTSAERLTGGNPRARARMAENGPETAPELRGAAE